MKLTVKEIKKGPGDIINMTFDKPKGFNFYPAQFIDLSVDLPAGRQGIPNPDNSRIYSFSSSPTEEDIMITFKKGVSDHKKKLQSLKPGDTVNITHPSGTYTLDETSPAVMIAGGVGIAPHRSMIKFAVDHKLKTPLTLIYSYRDSDFPFKKELDEWQKEYPNLTINYIESSKNGRINQELLKNLLASSQDLATASSLKSYFLNLKSIFYLAGLPSFVADMETILTQMGVDRVNIRLDSFDGY